MRADYFLSQLPPEDRWEVEVILEEARKAYAQEQKYDRIVMIRERISAGWHADLRQALKIIYGVTYFSMLLFSFDPVNGPLSRPFVYLLTAIPYSIVTLVSVLIAYGLLNAFLAFTKARGRHWEQHRHIFSDYLKKAERKWGYAAAADSDADWKKVPTPAFLLGEEEAEEEEVPEEEIPFSRRWTEDA